jgi:hypothetical protein
MSIRIVKKRCFKMLPRMHERERSEKAMLSERVRDERQKEGEKSEVHKAGAEHERKTTIRVSRGYSRSIFSHAEVRKFNGIFSLDWNCKGICSNDLDFLHPGRGERLGLLLLYRS